MRRDPDDPPDTNLDGFNFRLQKMDAFTHPGEDARREADAFERIKHADMVRAFILSTEYRARSESNRRIKALQIQKASSSQ